ncbi:MAG: hypothetical protein DHS20C20_26590 [Ardenticatenaceae bacterium]|nr:MAG: hypothetical protein DHS20C20_26590 [Ardenticatenaceae bacterium]
MNNENFNTAARMAAYTAMSGVVIGLTGTALWAASGTDLDLALANGDLSTYLIAAGEARNLLIANLTIWIVMVLLIGMAGTLLADLCVKRPLIAKLAKFSFRTSVPLVIVAYVAWLTIVVQIAPSASPEAIFMAEVMGWFASRADWIATILILGTGPALVSLAGRGDWVPTWLARWGVVALFAALLNAFAMLTGGAGLSTYGFIIIPVGMGWVLAAGIVALRRSKVTQHSEQAIDTHHLSGKEAISS